MERDPPPPPPPLGLRALVAEDDQEMRRLVCDVLRKEGFEVEEIPDGKQLLLRVVEAFLPRHADAHFDLLVSDVRMPFCSGLDVLKKLRTARRATPVVLMTAFGEPALRTQVRMLDALLLDKPFAPSTLKAAVREVLGVVRPTTA